MSSPDTHAVLGRWRLRHSHRLTTLAVKAVEQEEALHGALEDQAVSASLLQALGNTARTCSYRETLSFIERRAERRKKSGKMLEAAFWTATLRLLRRQVQEELPALMEACGHSPEVKPTSEAERETERLAQHYVARTLLDHFAAHCLYVRNKDSGRSRKDDQSWDNDRNWNY